MITVSLTTDQFAMLQRAVRNERDRKSALAYNSPWPANGHHEANVRLLDRVDDTLADAVARRIAEVTAR